MTAGKKDLVNHSNTLKHKTNSNKLVRQPTISRFLAPATVLKENVVNAELGIAAYCVEHNIAISSMGHLIKMLRHVIIDSEIVANINCARTKSTAIIYNVIGSTQSKNLYQIMNQSKLSMCIDESTDLSTSKLLSLVVRTSFQNKVLTSLYYA